MAARLRVLELYCGIGGCAAVVGPHAEVVAALDVNQVALGVYRHNFSHPAEARNLDSISARRLAAFEADLWWASPPCQPFTRRGRQRELEDPRAATFIHLLKCLEQVRPRFFAMENVEGFNDSSGHRLLLQTLERAGYGYLQEFLLCPSSLGLPNRRPRYYAVAGREPLLDPPFSPQPSPSQPSPPRRRTLAAILDGMNPGPEELSELSPEPARELYLAPDHVRRYRGALHVVDLRDPEAVTGCFTSAYGRSHVRSGSFLATADGVRRFSPAEILRLLAFPDSYSLPRDLPLANAYRLVGNSLSLVPVRAVLASVPGLLGERLSNAACPKSPKAGTAIEAAAETWTGT